MRENIRSSAWPARRYTSMAETVFLVCTDAQKHCHIHFGEEHYLNPFKMSLNASLGKLGFRE